MGIGAVVSSLLAIVLALALVLGLAWAVIWLLRRLQDRQMGGSAGEGEEAGRTLRFVRALPIGPRERLVLVEVGGEQLLVGVGGGLVTLVAHWDQAGRSLPTAGTGASEPPVQQRISPAMVAAWRDKGGRDG